jgi:hypothetical protein
MTTIGKRSYINYIALLIHQILKANGFDKYTGEDVSLAIDIFLIAAGIIFRFLATHTGKKTLLGFIREKLGLTIPKQ